MKNIAALLTGKEKIEFFDYPMPTLGDDDVLVEIKHCGICGSDVGVYADPTVGGALDITLPVMLGHESAGVVVGLGANVTDLAIGDKVALEPGVPCGKCEACLRGDYNLCDDVIFMAAPPFTTGAMCKYVAHPRSRTFKLPEGMSTIEGALMEPFSVGMFAAQHGEVDLTQSVAIIGGGCIGMMTALACRARGCTNIIIADLFDSHLEVARKLGFTKVFNSTGKDLAQCVRELNGGRGVDVAFETAGSAYVVGKLPGMVRRGGTIVLVGNIMKPVEFDFWSISYNQIAIKPIFRYKHLYPACIAVTAAGNAAVSDIGIKVYPFSEAPAAFDCALHDKLNTLKVIVEF